MNKLLDYATYSEATQAIPMPPPLLLIYDEPFASYIRKQAEAANEIPEAYVLRTVMFYEHETRGGVA